MKDDEKFNDPLEWWKERQYQFKVLARETVSVQSSTGKIGKSFLGYTSSNISTFRESMLELGSSNTNYEKS